MKHAMSWKLKQQYRCQVQNKSWIFCDFELFNQSLSMLKQNLPKEQEYIKQKYDSMILSLNIDAKTYLA